MMDTRIVEEIDRHLDSVVEKAHQLVDKSLNVKDMDKAQLRNVLDVATATESVRVVENFIHYQMGREGQQAWRNFGDDLMKEMEKLEETAREIASRTKADVKQVHIKLVRLLLGFLLRYYTYRKKMEESRGRAG